MAFLKTVETQGNDQKRYKWKKYFLLEMYRRGLSRETIAALYDFIDIVMALPKIRDEKLHEEVKQTTEENKVTILTTAERVGMKKGMKKGMKVTISDILEIKFGVDGLALADSVGRIDSVHSLQKIRLGLKQAQSVAEAKMLIQAQAKKFSRSN